MLIVEQLIEKALAVADRLYALSQGHIVMEADAREENLPARLERAYFGQDANPLSAGEIWGRARTELFNTGTGRNIAPHADTESRLQLRFLLNA